MTRRRCRDRARWTCAGLGLLAMACGGEEPSTTGLSGGTGGETSTATATDSEGETDPSTTAGSSSGSDTSDTDPPPACQSDADCQGNPDGAVCVAELGGQCRLCAPGVSESCYSGPAGTAGVGVCVAGTRSCAGDGASWSPCLGEVLPGNEDCANNIDDNCDGMIDEDIDADGDGFFACGGDCCDTKGAICQDPERVNPGAYEVPGNEVDDDCDGEEDEVEPTCDANLQTDAALAVEYARAMDLCQFTVEAPKKPEDWIWGVIDARFSLADGQGTPKSVARAIRPSFGDSIVAQGGAAMTVLSSGHAAATGDVKPAYAGFQPGVDHGLSSPPPADWFAANGGALPNPMGCPAPAVETANDPVMLTLRVRAPTNASSFSVDMFFFSAEYPEWVCSIYNDFFVALIDSDAPGNPEDLNIAIYDDGVDHWPVGVNLVKSVEGLFTACQNGVVGCLEKDIPESQYGGCAGAGALVGTGFDALDTGGCGDGKYVGGGTGWLKMRGNVVPGEVFELRLAIWDSGGHIFDSLVLLDGWEWSVEAAKPGLEPPE